MPYSFIRIAGAALGLAAIIAQLVRSVAAAQSSDTAYGSDVGTVLANFFSFFTIQSNVLAVITLAVGAVWMWAKGRDAEEEPRWFAVLLVCTSTYMIVTGIVYNTLLRGYALEASVVPWSNEVLHVVMPLFLLLDVLIAPKRRALSWRDAWIVVIFPIVWVVYTLLRAPLIIAPATGTPYWYPYPFLNPNNFEGGYAIVALYIVGIAVAIVAVGLLVIWIGRSRVARRIDKLVPDPGVTPSAAA